MNECTLVIIHGSKEHHKRYNNFQNYLESNNVNVVNKDLFDHGENIKGKFHNFSFEEMTSSVLEIIDEAKEKYPNTKLIVLGHSMGSFIAKYVAYNNLRDFDGIILSGTNDMSNPILGLLLFFTRNKKEKVSKFNEKLIYGGLVAISRLNGHGKEWLSNDMNNVENYAKDPLCGIDYSNKSMNAMIMFSKLSRGEEILSSFVLKDTPQLLIYGKDDPVANFGKDIKKLIKTQNKYGIKNHKVIEYKGSKHEIMLDFEKEKVFADILEFINSI